MKKIVKGQKGQALPIVLILLLIGGLLIVPTLNYASTSLKGHQVVESNTLEFYSADSGVEDALYWIIKGKEPGAWTWDEDTGYGERDTYDINARSVNVTVEEIGISEYKIVSIATSVDGHTTILSTVWAVVWVEGDQTYTSQNPPPAGGMHVNGDATISNPFTIEGNVTVDGSLTLETQVQLEGDVSVDGDLTLGQHCTITGDIVCVTGDITLGNTGDINADIHLLGEDCTITIDQPNATITGNIWADGDLTINITVGSASTVEILGSIYAPSGNISIYLGKKNSKIEGDIYASGTIQISGNGTHTGTPHPSYTGEPPFEIAPCLGFPSSPVAIYTYEII